MTREPLLGTLPKMGVYGAIPQTGFSFPRKLWAHASVPPLPRKDGQGPFLPLPCAYPARASGRAHALHVGKFGATNSIRRTAEVPLTVDGPAAAQRTVSS